MNALRATALLLIAAGVALLGYGIATGAVQVAIVLIFPVIYGTGGVALVAILLIMVGVFLLFASLAARPPTRDAFGDYGYAEGESGRVVLRPQETSRGHATQPDRDAEERPPERRVKTGGVILIGPFPIAWGTERGMVKGLVLLMIVLMVVGLLFLWLAGQTAGF